MSIRIFHFRVLQLPDLRLDNQILRAEILCDLLGLGDGGGDAELGSGHTGVLQQGHGDVLVDAQIADLRCYKVKYEATF